MKEGKFESKSYDENLPGFIIKTTAKDSVKSGAFKYKMKAFVCTEDKKRCYPQSHSGEVKWSL